MLYQTYQIQDDLIAPIRRAARRATLADWPRFWSWGDTVWSRIAAAQEMISRFELRHTRPDFGITDVEVGNRAVPVTEEVVLDQPFGKLLRFAKDIDSEQPRILIAAPLSGHFATLLRGTVETLLRDHDVYITDWKNARDVPTDAGHFGVEDYVTYLIQFLETIGPGAHLLAVCQPRGGTSCLWRIH